MTASAIASNDNINGIAANPQLRPAFMPKYSRPDRNVDKHAMRHFTS